MAEGSRERMEGWRGREYESPNWKEKLGWKVKERSVEQGRRRGKRTENWWEEWRNKKGKRESYRGMADKLENVKRREMDRTAEGEL